jgi:hypothetical protein
MSFLDNLKAKFGKAKDKSDDLVDEHRERIPDDIEQKYDKASGAAEKIAPGDDRPAAGTTPPEPPT